MKNNKKINFGIIIQARMGSKRLPGKILKSYKQISPLKLLIDRLTKMKFSKDQIIIATTIKKEIRDFGEREIESKQVGETVMRHLKKLDEVAFVRFASVYRSFQDPNEFSEEVKKLSDE